MEGRRLQRRRALCCRVLPTAIYAALTSAGIGCLVTLSDGFNIANAIPSVLLLSFRVPPGRRRYHPPFMSHKPGAAGSAAWQASAAAALAMGASLASPSGVAPGATAGASSYAARLAARERDRGFRDDRPPRDRDADKGPRVRCCYIVMLLL
jgi:hypothetical protein